MKKNKLSSILLLAALLIPSAVLAAKTDSVEQKDTENIQPSLKNDTLFTVSSDELDPTDSLNRISGNIDLGFSSPSQSFKSSDHYTAGPFSREKAVESS